MTKPNVLAALVLPWLAACSAPDSGDEAPTPAANHPAEPTLTGAPEPSSPPAATGDGRLRAWVKQAYGDMGTLVLRSGRVDLDGDGVAEVLAYVGGPMLCGTGGCNLLVLKDDGKAFTKVGDLSVSQLPVGVLATSTNGWRDLAVTTYGGGAKARVMRVPFGGNSYAGNPTVAPASETARIETVVIADGELERLD